MKSVIFILLLTESRLVYPQSAVLLWVVGIARRFVVSSCRSFFFFSIDYKRYTSTKFPRFTVEVQLFLRGKLWIGSSSRREICHVSN